jgi:hypothetical protein
MSSLSLGAPDKSGVSDKSENIETTEIGLNVSVLTLSTPVFFSFFHAPLKVSKDCLNGVGVVHRPVVRQNVARATLQRLLSTWRNAFGLDSRLIGGGRELLPESVDGQRLRLGSDKRERAWSLAK